MEMGMEIGMGMGMEMEMEMEMEMPYAFLSTPYKDHSYIHTHMNPTWPCHIPHNPCHR